MRENKTKKGSGSGGSAQKKYKFSKEYCDSFGDNETQITKISAIIESRTETHKLTKHDA